MQATVSQVKPSRPGISINALCKSIQKDRVPYDSNKTKAIFVSFSSFIGLVLVSTVLPPEKKIFPFKVSHLNSNAENSFDSDSGSISRIFPCLFLALLIGKIVYSRLNYLQTMQNNALKTFRMQIPKDKQPLVPASSSLLRSGMRCLTEKSQEALVQKMDFPQLIAIADHVGQRRLRKLLTGINQWDAFLMRKILELPTSGEETFQKLCSEDYRSYLQLSVFFYKGLQEHLKNHEKLEVHTLLRQFQWTDLSAPKDQEPSTLRIDFSNGSQAFFPTQPLITYCAVFQKQAETSEALSFRVSSAYQKTFETFIQILKEKPEKLKTEEVKCVFPLACDLLATKIVDVFDTYIAAHLEEFQDREIENLIQKYFAFLSDTKSQYELYLIAQKKTSISELAKFYKKAQHLKLSRLRRYSVAYLNGHLLKLLRRPKKTKLTECLSVIKQTLNESEYTNIMTNLTDEVSPLNVVELYQFSCSKACHSLKETTLNFCRNNKTLLASQLVTAALPKEIREILYPKADEANPP